jgi:hypothetical protein
VLTFGLIVWSASLRYLLTVILRLIHKLLYRFKGHDNLHGRSYKENDNIYAPLERGMLNDTSHFHLGSDVIDWVPRLPTKVAYCKEEIKHASRDNLCYTHVHDTDWIEIANWTWPYWWLRRRVSAGNRVVQELHRRKQLDGSQHSVASVIGKGSKTDEYA